MDYLINLTKDNIQHVVDTSMQKMVVLAFWTQQQPESVQMLQTLELLANAKSGRFILAKVDCETELEIANYFQIQNLPTTLILDKGRPIDGFAGVQSQEQISDLLDKHLPPMWIQAFEDIKQQLAQGQLSSEALTNIAEQLKTIYADAQQAAEVALVMTDVALQLGLLAEAKVLLARIGLADQDSYYHNLVAKLALAEDAADTPEIRQLQQNVAEHPDDLDAVIILAKALNAAHRNEEALELLFTILQKDLNAAEGKVKQVFMEILTAIGQGNMIANQYRRKLYTLLY
ncbi:MULTISPECIES: tetratricopeptide repeat protein [Shewanella]|jgi:putative thioredoxin|uniref:tetratricopeptide repeat protein n=1 Tax=Shewanella TaxID=22 RepID=UPI000C680995|nr:MULTISPECIES: tetratricopeptide repeat protein [Shewanella]NCQ45018.1 tetratricopeptide repeat protein [Shewanella frigidimarina]NCO71274.1 tetratricopeptide repeat protein [Shewanella vesiculosa]NCP37440.1 tetratricopeptide repeat protein [Shewanella vesiculosa]NCP70741.1 tetratricopeptide repeat protein [Shewanella vesiculosa]NCP74894.1 tetratricopeptide repeat protein [Shewanella vesiculosa]